MEYVSCIYEDLPKIDLCGDIERLQEQNSALQDHIDSLKSDIEKLCSNVSELKRIQNNLTRNISELYKTAKGEIERKDKQIAELRSQLERRFEPRQLPALHPKREKDYSPRHRDSGSPVEKKYKRYDENHARIKYPSHRSRSRSSERHRKSYKDKYERRRDHEHYGAKNSIRNNINMERNRNEDDLMNDSGNSNRDNKDLADANKSKVNFKRIDARRDGHNNGEISSSKQHKEYNTVSADGMKHANVIQKTNGNEVTKNIYKKHNIANVHDAERDKKQNVKDQSKLSLPDTKCETPKDKNECYDASNILQNEDAHKTERPKPIKEYLSSEVIISGEVTQFNSSNISKTSKLPSECHVNPLQIYESSSNTKNTDIIYNENRKMYDKTEHNDEDVCIKNEQMSVMKNTCVIKSNTMETDEKTTPQLPERNCSVLEFVLVEGVKSSDGLCTKTNSGKGRNKFVNLKREKTNILKKVWNMHSTNNTDLKKLQSDKPKKAKENEVTKKLFEKDGIKMKSDRNLIVHSKSSCHDKDQIIQFNEEPPGNGDLRKDLKNNSDSAEKASSYSITSKMDSLTDIEEGEIVEPHDNDSIKVKIFTDINKLFVSEVTQVLKEKMSSKSKPIEKVKKPSKKRHNSPTSPSKKESSVKVRKDVCNSNSHEESDRVLRSAARNNNKEKSQQCLNDSMECNKNSNSVADVSAGNLYDDFLRGDACSNRNRTSLSISDGSGVSDTNDYSFITTSSPLAVDDPVATLELLKEDLNISNPDQETELPVDLSCNSQHVQNDSGTIVTSGSPRKRRKVIFTMVD